MRGKKFILGFLVILSLFVFACSSQDDVDLMNRDLASQQHANNDDVVNEVLVDALVDDSDDGISREQVLMHNSIDSCWVGYNGYVYDLTEWLIRHPGGADVIIPNCGTIEEFTVAYNDQHNKAGTKSELTRNQAIGVLV